MISRLFFRIISFTTLSVLAVSASADHSWNNYHWARTANPFNLLVVDSVTSDWSEPLTLSLIAWSNPDPSTITGVLDLEIIDTDF